MIFKTLVNILLMCIERMGEILEEEEHRLEELKKKEEKKTREVVEAKIDTSKFLMSDFSVDGRLFYFQIFQCLHLIIKDCFQTKPELLRIGVSLPIIKR